MAYCLRKRFPLRMLWCDVWFKDIPRSTIFGHPYGITIRQGVKIGENCTFASNVTIGQRNGERDCAVIGDNVFFGSGATVLGPVHIGNNAVIGANTTVLRDIGIGETYTGKTT